MEIRDSFIERLLKYKKNSEILRQIHSNKAFIKQKLAIWHLTSTLVLTAIISFIGFMGVDKFSKLIDPKGLLNYDLIQFIYNVSVFLILVLIIVELIFNFKERANHHYKSITILTGFIRDVDDLIHLQNYKDEEIDTLIFSIRERYKLITEILPPSTDREFIKSKIDYTNKKLNLDLNEKNLKQKKLNLFLVDPSYGKFENKIINLLKDDPWMMEIVSSVKNLKNYSLWISGGFIRNKVWDIKHNYKIRTRLDDVDIIYFDQTCLDKKEEKAIEEKLKKILPNITWSVKNQARMHTKAEDEPYTSLYDALFKWPETATAIAVQIDENGFFKIIAPFGYKDLFNLIVRPPDYFKEKHLLRYKARIKEKNWKSLWPKLKIIDV